MPPFSLNTVTPSAMEVCLNMQSQEGLLSFSLGLPDPELFPNQLLQSCMSNIFSKHPNSLQYAQPSQGLKTHIKTLMYSRGIHCDEENILLTSGAQQGISLLARLLIGQNKRVLLEPLTYPGVLQAIQPYQPQIITFETVKQLESLLRNNRMPSFLYIIPNGSNPKGSSLTLEDRVVLYQLSERYGLPIIEDDPYGFLSYEAPIRTIKQQGEDNILYIGSFSKILAPSLRTGWIVAPKEIIRHLQSIKESFDINTANLNQYLIQTFLTEHKLEQHLHRLRQAYQVKRDKLLTTLNTHFPKDCRFFKPKHGFFIWVDFPAYINTTNLLTMSLSKYKVSFMPSTVFLARHEQNIQNGIRLSFSHLSLSKIESGIQKLGHLIQSNYTY